LGDQAAIKVNVRRYFCVSVNYLLTFVKIGSMIAG
jgi:hypothetical protein